MNNISINQANFDFFKSKAHLEINDLTLIPDEIPVVTLRDVPFACKGDISFISGKAKAGKTQLVQFIISTSLCEIKDSLHIKTVPCNKKYIIYIDTEQSRSTLNKVRRKTLAIAGLDKQPEYLKFFNLRGLNIEAKKAFLTQLTAAVPDIHLIIIDGVADFVTEVNKAEECNAIIDFLQQLAENHQTTIIGFIHENQTSRNYEMRGHLGSQASRKSGGSLSVRKNREEKNHEIRPMYLRYSGDFDPIFFHYDSEQNRMVTDHSDRRSNPQEDKKEDYITMIAQIFSDKIEFSNKELVSAIIYYSKQLYGKGYSETTFNRIIKQILEQKMIMKNDKKRYVIFLE